MKKFLFSIACVSALVLAFYAVLIGRYAYKMQGYSFALPEDVTILIAGDSQLQAAVNDSIWTECHNISQAHEHYWALLKRLQLYVEVNPQIRDVILGVSPRAFSANADARLTEEWYVGDITKSYLPYWSLGEWLMLLRRNLASVISNLATPVSFYWNVNPDYIQKLGRFETVKESHMAEFNAVEYFKLSEDEPIEWHQTIGYIHEILKYCNDHNIRVTLCSTPIYDAQNVLPFIPEFYDIIHSEFPKLPFIDLLNADLPSEWFRDNNHLNQTGAEWGTQEIRNQFYNKRAEL